MNKLIIILLFILFSCSKGKIQKIKIYNQNDFEKIIEVVDTFCINETKRAKLDLKKNKIYYCDSEFKYGLNEMKNLLKSIYNVEYKPTLESSIKNYMFEYDCYERIMNQKVDELIGFEKIDSLWSVAELTCYKKYPDSIWIENGFDIREKLRLKK